MLESLLVLMPSRAMRGARSDLETLAGEILESESDGNPVELNLMGRLYINWLGNREKGVELLREHLIRGGLNEVDLQSEKALRTAMERLGEEGAVDESILDSYARFLSELKVFGERG